MITPLFRIFCPFFENQTNVCQARNFCWISLSLVFIYLGVYIITKTPFLEFRLLLLRVAPYLQFIITYCWQKWIKIHSSHPSYFRTEGPWVNGSVTFAIIIFFLVTRESCQTQNAKPRIIRRSWRQKWWVWIRDILVSSVSVSPSAFPAGIKRHLLFPEDLYTVID